MAYSSDVADLLARQIQRFVTLNRHQLAGQVANLEFWADEARHAFAVIDGYKARFDRMSQAQAGYAAEHRTRVYDTTETPFPGEPLRSLGTAEPPRRVSHAALDESRRSLADAFYRFLARGFKEGMIDVETARDTCDRLGLGIENKDFR